MVNIKENVILCGLTINFNDHNNLKTSESCDDIEEVFGVVQLQPERVFLPHVDRGCSLDLPQHTRNYAVVETMSVSGRMGARERQDPKLDLSVI